MSPAGRTGDPAEVHHVEHVMGTVFSLRAMGPRHRATALRAAMVRAVTWLHEVDDRFTTYRSSEWLDVVAGELHRDAAHPDIGTVIDSCERLARLTDGAFDIVADPTRPPDPAAYVKGWSVDRAAQILVDAGADGVCVNGGGDIAVAGSVDARPWRVGIQDPFDPAMLRATVEIDTGAVATSGTYERGAHVYDPRRNEPVVGIASVTVIGPYLAMADALSTAAFVDGDRSVAWLHRIPDYRAYLIHLDGHATTIGWPDAA